MIRTTSTFFLALSFILSISTNFGSAGPATVPDKAGLVYAEGDRLMLDGEVFIMKGFNYYPRDYGWTSMEDWDWEAVDREFALAASLNANTIRTGISWQYATGNINGEYNIYTHYHIRPETLEAIEHLLSLADKHGLKVVLWLNDALYWEFWNPANYSVVENFLKEFIPPFAGDPRIAAWDLATDLDGTMLQRPPSGAFGENPYSTKEYMLKLLRNISDTVRELDPDHLQAVGFCWASSSILVQDFTDFLFFQFLGADQPEVVNSDSLDVAENYGKWDEVLVDRAAVVDRLEAKIESIQKQLTKPMPIVPSEYGLPSAPPDGSPELQAGVYEAVNELVFLRLQLAGALNWALVDFTWPPKAYTYIPDDAPQNTSAEQSFGVFDLEYNPKPAAEVAASYYTDSPQMTLGTNPNQLQFKFSRYFVPGSDDPRKLSVAFDTIVFLDEAGSTLLSLDVGTDEARPYLGSGFFEDEGVWGKEVDNFAWAGGEEKQAFVNVDIPAETHSISLTLNNQMDNMHLIVMLNGISLQDLLLKKSWKEYTVDLETPSKPQAGMDMRVYGRFNLAISDGTVSLQTSSDGDTWQDVGTTNPVEGYFSGDISLEQAGTLYVRAVWSENAMYQEAASEPLTLEIAPLSSALLLENLPESLVPGTTFQINGRLEPALAGETISIELESPDRSTIEQVVRTSEEGSFSAEIGVDQTGSWSIQVSWAGNSQYTAAEIEEILVVKQPTAVPESTLTPTFLAPDATPVTSSSLLEKFIPVFAVLGGLVACALLVAIFWFVKKRSNI